MVVDTTGDLETDMKKNQSDLQIPNSETGWTGLSDWEFPSIDLEFPSIDWEFPSIDFQFPIIDLDWSITSEPNWFGNLDCLTT